MKIIVSLSGGLDSAVLMYQLIAEGHEVKAISIDYGQRHHRELDAAANLCHIKGIEHRIANMLPIRPFLAGSSQTSDEIEVPKGHYEDESMKLTVVPNRNMILLAVATAWAVSLKYDAVAYAAHAGDHAIYPDCRPEFAEAMAKAMELCDYQPIKLLRPFVGMTKADIVLMGHRAKVPFAKTWSCYQGLEYHCGECGTCVERKEAFLKATVKDPTLYQVR